MKGQPELKKVGDVMTHEVASIPPSAPFKEIAQSLRQHRVGALPVIDALGQVVGVVSETDLLPKEEPPEVLDRHFFDTKSRRQLRRKATALRAIDLMTRPALTVKPQDKLRDVARTMIDNHVHQMPVVDASGKLVGMVTRGDVLQVFVRDDDSIREEVVKDVIEQTLGLDSGDLQVAVEGGVVLLKGEVERKSDISLLVARVREIEGVVGVMDRLCSRWDDTNLDLYEEAVLAPFGSTWRNRGW